MTVQIRHVACTLFALYYVNHQTQSEIFGAEEQMEVGGEKGWEIGACFTFGPKKDS